MRADRTPCAEMIVFLDLFESFGLTHSDVTALSLDKDKINGKKVGGEKKKFLPKLSASDLRRRLPKEIEYADRHEWSVVVSHPYAPGIKFIQCDDVSGEVLKRLKPVAFMILETSPGSFQAWIAMREKEAASGDYYRRLREGVSSDKSASEATRCPGSHNFKSKYQDENGNYPVVRITHAVPGKIATGKELVATGLLAEKAISRTETVTKQIAPRKLIATSTSHARSGSQEWPDYTECVRYGQQRGDRDRGDFRFAWIAADRGFSLEEVASELMRRSPRASEDRNPDRYCRRKAKDGAKYAVKYAATHSKPKGVQKPLARSRTPVRGETPLVASATSFGKPPRPNARRAAPVSQVQSSGMPVTKRASKSRVLAICSTREDAVILQEATGIRAVRITLRAFPAEMQLRCALRRVIIATRQDKSGEAVARRIVETCTLSTLKRIPWPQEELDEQTLFDTLRNLFTPH